MHDRDVGSAERGAGVLGLWVLGNVYAMIKLAPVAAKAAPTIIKMLPMAAL